MKITAAAVLASCTPSLGFALDGSGWSIAKVPSVGLSDVTFPFNITNAPHKTGYFFAQQFNFNGQSNNGYTGLQPRPDSGGKPIIHAVSTSFVAGTTTNDPTATLGLMVVLNTVGTTWIGTLVDDTTKVRTKIGTWMLPAGTGGIKGRQFGFVEYYLWNDGQNHPCSTLPYADVTFGIPISSTVGGNLADAYEYGDCFGKVGYKTARTANGVRIQVGF